MASKKKQAPAREAVLSAKLPNGETLELAKPDTEQWDRYLDKLSRGQDLVGKRELVQVCCISHAPDKETGRIQILDKLPALIKKLTDKLDSVCGGDFEVQVDGESSTVTVSDDVGSVVFSGPNIDEWERLQESLEDRRKRLGPTLRGFLETLADSPPDAAKLFERHCAIIGPISRAVGEIAGTEITVEVKKG